MSRISLSEADTSHAMVVEGPQTPKGIRTGFTSNCILHTFQEFPDLFDHVNPHIVGPTITLSGTAKDTAFVRTIKSLRIQGGMPPLATKVLQVLLQRLLLEKDLVTEPTLVLPRSIMPIQVHTQSAGLGRREITLRTRIQPCLILDILPLPWHFKWIRDSGLPTRQDFRLFNFF